jgi:hypothetical protein
MGAEEDLAVEVERGVDGVMIESDYIGWTVMIEPAPVEDGHGGGGEEMEAEGERGEVEFGLEEVLGHVGEDKCLDAAAALAIADEDFVHVGGLPRCSS